MVYSLTGDERGRCVAGLARLSHHGNFFQAEIALPEDKIQLALTADDNRAVDRFITYHLHLNLVASGIDSGYAVLAGSVAGSILPGIL